MQTKLNKNNFTINNEVLRVLQKLLRYLNDTNISTSSLLLVPVLPIIFVLESNCLVMLALLDSTMPPSAYTADLPL